MKKSYRLLKSSTNKSLKKELKKLYGFKVPNTWTFFQISDERIWLMNQDLAVFDDSKLNVESKGLYFCYFDKDRLRLSPEGAQLVGQSATRNVLNISDEQAEEIIRGFDIQVDASELNAEYIILKTRKGILGVGKNHKTKVLCQFRKNRRIRKLSHS